MTNPFIIPPTILDQPGGAMPDPQTQNILDLVAKADVPHYKSLTPKELRQGHEAFFAPLSLPPEDTVNVIEKHIPGPADDIRIRIYQPLPLPDSPLPVMIYYHGGGMMVGSIELYDTICQRLCKQSGIIIVSVDYRLSPENKFPAAVHDAYAAVLWTSKNAPSFKGDPHKLAIGGDSGGGNLAAVATQLLRDKNGPKISFQLLIYPAVGNGKGYKSLSIFDGKYLSECEQLLWFYDQYMSSPDQINDPRVSPILTKDLSNLPPAFIITAGFDILRDEGEHYAERLREAGVATELHRYETTIHPFLNMAGVVEPAKDALDECGQKLRKAFQL